MAEIVDVAGGGLPQGKDGVITQRFLVRGVPVPQLVAVAGVARRVLGDLGVPVVSYKTIQRHLGLIGPGGYRDAMAGRCLAHAVNRGGLTLLLNDVTTLYFEAESEDDLRICADIGITRSPAQRQRVGFWDMIR